MLLAASLCLLGAAVGWRRQPSISGARTAGAGA